MTPRLATRRQREGIRFRTETTGGSTRGLSSVGSRVTHGSSNRHRDVRYSRPGTVRHLDVSSSRSRVDRWHESGGGAADVVLSAWPQDSHCPP